jgi:transcriptional antiterminator NusG
MDTASWFAVQVLATREKNVQKVLTYKGYEVLLPLYKALIKWSDRYKVSERALFPGYLFARFDPSLKPSIVATQDILQIVGFGNRPVPIPEDEIDAIQILTRSHTQAIPHPYLRAGERVMITEGPLAGVFGMLVRAKSALRLVITIELLQRSVAVEVDANSIRPVTARLPAVGLLPPLVAKY